MNAEGKRAPPAAGWTEADVYALVGMARTGGAIGRRWVSLETLIGDVDYFGRFVFHADELEEAVRRLTGAGLIELKGDKLRLTEPGAALVRHQRAPSPMDEFSRLRFELADRAVPADGSGEQPTPGASAKALDRYHRDMDRLRRKL